MDMPSTLGLKITRQTFLPEWEKLRLPEDFSKMEQWGIDNLQPRNAAIGSFTRTITASNVELGQFWIIRRGDYDTGRPNIEIQVRLTRGMRVYVWDLRDDVLLYGRVRSFVVTSRYERTHAPDGLQWELLAMQRYATADIKELGAAVRTPELFEQCCAFSNAIARWLGEYSKCFVTSPIAIKGTDWHTECASIHRLVAISPLWLAAFPARYDRLATTKTDVVPDTVATLYRRGAERWEKQTVQELRRRNRLSTPAQLALFNRLKKTWVYLDALHRRPSALPYASHRSVNPQTLSRFHRRCVYVCQRDINTFHNL